MTPNKCQSIYRNALDALQIAHATADPLHSVGYLRALYQTQRCDHIGTNLDSQRKDVAIALQLGRLRRLVEQNGGATQEDYIEAHHTVRHYAPSHRDGLMGALTSTWPQWIEYHTTAGLEQTAAVVSAVGGVLGFAMGLAPNTRPLGGSTPSPALRLRRSCHRPLTNETRTRPRRRKWHDHGSTTVSIVRS